MAERPKRFLEFDGAFGTDWEMCRKCGRAVEGLRRSLELQIVGQTFGPSFSFLSLRFQ